MRTLRPGDVIKVEDGGGGFAVNEVHVPGETFYVPLDLMAHLVTPRNGNLKAGAEVWALVDSLNERGASIEVTEG